MGMYSGPVVYVDIETTGMSPGRGRIIEIAAIRVDRDEVTADFHSFVNPDMPLSQWITNLTGIQDRDLASAPRFEDIAWQLQDVLQGALFIAHNVRFDYSFIKYQLEACGYPFTPKLLCTVRLSRALYAKHKGHSLEKIIARHELSVDARHRAYNDAKAIKDFAELAYEEHGPERFTAAVMQQLGQQSLPPHLPESELLKARNRPGVYVFEDETGQPIYVGKSVKLRSRVLSHFNQTTTQPKEMKMAQQTHRLRLIETNNELDALLLESRMIKELLPVYNKQLRRQNSHTVLLRRKNPDGYITLSIEDRNIAAASDLDDIYGVYTSRGKAKIALEDKLRTFSLCSRLLGLEKAQTGCFLSQLGKCRGACQGRETPERYNVRVELALERSKLESWPYGSAVAIRSEAGDALVVDKWVVLGHLIAVEEAEPYFKPVDRSFDIDTYRILRGYLAKYADSLAVTPITSSALSQLAL